jgi:hypothetical protein
MLKKQLKFGDITRIANEFDCSATYVQQALSGNCETKLCRSIRDYAKFIVTQYQNREEELKRIIALQRANNN